MARPARTTIIRTWRRRFPARPEGRPILGDPPPRWHEPVRLAAAGWGDSNSTASDSPTRGQKAVGRATCGFAELPVSAPACCCPPFTCRLRTQHGPMGVPGPWSRTPAALRSSATRDRSAGRARQGRCKPRPTYPLLRSWIERDRDLPRQGSGAGRGRLGVVRGCPLRSGCDCAVNGTLVARPSCPWRSLASMSIKMRADV
jgi:hypothetical protein